MNKLHNIMNTAMRFILKLLINNNNNNNKI